MASLRRRRCCSCSSSFWSKRGRISILLSVCSDTRRDFTENLLQPYLVARKPFYIVEGLDVHKAVWRQGCQRVECVVASVREVRRHGRGNFVRLKEIDDFMTLALKIWVHLPNRSETMQMLGIMFAQ